MVMRKRYSSGLLWRQRLQLNKDRGESLCHSVVQARWSVLLPIFIPAGFCDGPDVEVASSLETRNRVTIAATTEGLHLDDYGWLFSHFSCGSLGH